MSSQRAPVGLIMGCLATDCEILPITIKDSGSRLRPSLVAMMDMADNVATTGACAIRATAGSKLSFA
ncbi:hypothetical protein NDU88_003070 [Pleurodeles waltl]|uniref:Uncharacterized protein n=1 Tax=Pleurodeles waltl TaxID=8319 RepID=A0AAV7SEC4_PLEWA|nr:hypothetical protein NDU88_003070 [Pleurodeles waltl]